MPQNPSLLQRLMLVPQSMPEPPKPPVKQLPAPIREASDMWNRTPLNIQPGPKVNISDPNGKLSGNYDGDIIKRIANMAKLEGVDPLTALAVSGQESTFGRYDAENPMRLNFDVHGGMDYGENDKSAYDDRVLQKSMQYLKSRTDRQRSQTPEDEELILQSYNGFGKVQGGSEVAEGAEMYGGQTELHGGRDRPYGKAIMQLREMLANQPSIQKIIK